MKLKESVGEQYEIDISPIQNDGDEMLSFQEMLEDIVELVYHDFKNGKLDKDSSVCEFYKTYEKIKDLSLKNPKKFVKQYGWAFEDKIKDKNLKEGIMKKYLKENGLFRKGQAFEGKRGKLYISKQLSPDEYLVRYSDFLLPSLSFTDWTFSVDELKEAIKKVQSGEQLVWDHFQALKEDRFDKLEYLYIKGNYALIRKYEQGPFLKKILNGNVFDKLYRYVSAGKLKTKDNPFNVKNWKVGDDILLGLTSTLPFEDPKNLKKDLGVNFSYCMVFKDVKGYSVKYDAKDFTGYKGIEDYKWQKEVLTAGLFHVDNIEQKGKITYVELSTVKQDKETFIEILRKTREDLESGEFNKQYPTSLGVKYANYDVLEKELKDADLTIFNTNNLSQKDIDAIKKLPKINTYEDLYYFIKEYDLYKDLQPLCIEELPKEFTKEVWNNTLISMRLALPEDIFPQNKDEAYGKWNCVRPQIKWPKVEGEYISFQNNLEGIWFIANKYFALKSIKEKLEKDLLGENKYGGFKMKKYLKESELCPRNAYNKRQREINRENDATLVYGKIDDAMSAEFAKDSFFKNVPGSHHWSETVGNLAFVCSVDEDNCSKAHFSTYKNKKRIDSKYVYLNGDCVEQFYEYISNWV